jgi:hypothetical protein
VCVGRYIVFVDVYTFLILGFELYDRNKVLRVDYIVEKRPSIPFFFKVEHFYCTSIYHTVTQLMRTLGVIRVIIIRVFNFVQ